MCLAEERVSEQGSKNEKDRERGESGGKKKRVWKKWRATDKA